MSSAIDGCSRRPRGRWRGPRRGRLADHGLFSSSGDDTPNKTVAASGGFRGLFPVPGQQRVVAGAVSS
ncbi:MAG TPA: hypothetical protein HPP75_04505 [Rhodospirillaceae bacterium]|nr:hypothetical protein [Rhodospirillaceae bacterium]